ncbi:MAG: glycosyltransferase 61 family protein [Caulobacteraceae bacterium]
MKAPASPKAKPPVKAQPKLAQPPGGHLGGIERYFNAGDYAAALNHAAQAEKNDVLFKAPKRLVMAIRAAVQLNRYDISDRYIAEYEKRFGRTTLLRGLQADILFKKGDFSGALPLYQRLLDDNPLAESHWERVYVLMRRLGAPIEERREFLHRWSRSRPGKKPDLHLARLLAEEADYRGSAELFEAIEGSGVMSVDDYLLAGRCLTDMGESARKIRLIKNGVDRYATSSALRQALASELLKAGDSAAAQAQLYETIASQQSVESTLALFGNNAPLVDPLVGKLAELTLLPRSGPDDPETLIGLANILLEPRRRLKDLLKGFERETPPLYVYGAADSGKAQRTLLTLCAVAASLLKAALAMDPANAEARRVLADIGREVGDPKAAAAIRREFIAHDSGAQNDAWLNLAEDLLAACVPDEAIEAFSTANGGAKAAFAPFVAIEDWIQPASKPSTDLAAAVTATARWTAIIDETAAPVEIAVRHRAVTVYPVSGVEVRDGVLCLNARGEALLSDIHDTQGASFANAIADRAGIIALENGAEVVEIAEPVIFLGGRSMHYGQYFHAITQNYARLPALSGAEDRRLLIPSDTPEWALYLLARLGYPEDRLAYFNWTDRLRLADALMFNPPRRDDVLHPGVVASFRERLGVGEGEGKRKIFMQRGAAKNVKRMMMNEVALSELAIEAGFEVVDPGLMPLEEQIALFSDAAVICGATGAALTNAVFAPAQAKVVCLSPRETCRNYFPLTSAALGQEFYWCLGKMVPEGFQSRGFPHVPYSVNATVFRNLLERL